MDAPHFVEYFQRPIECYTYQRRILSPIGQAECFVISRTVLSTDVYDWIAGMEQ